MCAWWHIHSRMRLTIPLQGISATDINHLNAQCKVGSKGKWCRSPSPSQGSCVVFNKQPGFYAAINQDEGIWRLSSDFLKLCQGRPFECKIRARTSATIEGEKRIPPDEELPWWLRETGMQGHKYNKRKHSLITEVLIFLTEKHKCWKNVNTNKKQKHMKCLTLLTNKQPNTKITHLRHTREGQFSCHIYMNIQIVTWN